MTVVRATLLLALMLAPRVEAQAIGPCRRGFEHTDRLIEISGGTLYADLNGDGLPDTITSSAQSIDIELNRGGAVFEPVQRFNRFTTEPNLGFASLRAVKDLDGDGHHDLLFAHEAALAALPGEGGGTFSTKGALRVLERILNPGGWRVADLEGDGVPEIVAMAGRSFLVVQYRGGQIELAAELAAVPGNVTDMTSPWVSGDFDGDGKEDLLATVYDPATGRWKWLFYWSNGELRFTPSVAVLSEPPTVLSAADIDGDGAHEIVGTFTDELLVVEATREAATERRLPIDLLPPNQRIDATADLDVDGVLDIVFAAALGAGVIWGDLTGFEAASTFAIPQGSDQVAVLDINGDSYLDLVVGRAVAYGRGTRNVTAPRRYPLVTNGGDFFRADVDEDGREDVIVTVEGGTEVLFATSEGFRRGVRVKPGRSLTDEIHAVTDLDGDGHVDIAGNIGITVSGPALFFGNGPTLTPVVSINVPTSSGRFAGSVILHAGQPAVMLLQTDRLLQTVAVTPERSLKIETVVTLAAGEVFQVIDADADGDSDLLVRNRNEYGIVENRDGTWLPATPIVQSTSNSVNGATGGDIDGDGASELLLWSNRNIRFYRRTGNGTYSELPLFASTVSITDVHVTDWDRDGLNDLVVVGPGHDRESLVQLLRNEGTRFVPAAAGTISKTRASYVTDFDSDGWPDLVAVTSFGVEIVRNVCAAPRVRVTAVPAMPRPGEPVTLLAFAVPVDDLQFTSTMTFRSDMGTLCEIQVEPFDYDLARCTIGPLPQGVHRVTASYPAQYSGLEEASTVIVVAPPSTRRRSLRH
jgi:hypothetical protein